MAAAVVGFLLDRNQLLAGGLLLVGAFLLCVCIFAPRMVGEQKVSLNQFCMMLARSSQISAEAERADIELKAQETTVIEDIKA